MESLTKRKSRDIYQFSDDIHELPFETIRNSAPFYSSPLALFHYTNKTNLQYIVKDDHIDLRLTRADRLADSIELQHIIKVFQDPDNPDYIHCVLPISALYDVVEVSK